MPSSLLYSPSPLWFPAGVDFSFEGIPISNAVHSGHLAACSENYLALVTGVSGGGSVALIDLSKASTII